MSAGASEKTIRVQELIWRKVIDAEGKQLGRLYELEAKRVGDELRVVALLVGPGTWITRFGWSRNEHGTRVPWEHVDRIDPDITLLHPHGNAQDAGS